MGGRMGGGKAVPKAIHILHGNPSQKTKAELDAIWEPGVLDKTPRAPAHLDKAAKKQWRYIAPKLAALGVLSDIDIAALTAYCKAHSRGIELDEEIKKALAIEGRVIDAPLLALFRASNQNTDQIRKFLIEFGMTPSSRSRVTVQKRGKKKSAYEEWKEGEK